MAKIHSGAQVKPGDVITLCHIERSRYTFAWSRHADPVTCPDCRARF